MDCGHDRYYTETMGGERWLLPCDQCARDPMPPDPSPNVRLIDRVTLRGRYFGDTEDRILYDGLGIVTIDEAE